MRWLGLTSKPTDRLAPFTDDLTTQQRLEALTRRLRRVRPPPTLPIILALLTLLLLLHRAALELWVNVIADLLLPTVGGTRA